MAKQYTDPVHARTWQLLAQQLDGHYDQLAARKQSMDIVKKMPWVRYEYLLEYAEWLAMEVTYTRLPLLRPLNPKPQTHRGFGNASGTLFALWIRLLKSEDAVSCIGLCRPASLMPLRTPCGLPSTS